MLLLYAVLIGLAVGLASGGRLSALGTVHIRFWSVALAGLLLQALLFSSALAASVGELGPPLYVVSTAAVLMALIVNVRLPGFWLIALGAACNFGAIVVNGGQMPASPEAVAILSGSPVLPTTGFSNSIVATGATQLGFLGDVFALPRPFPLANVFSLGDVLIGIGGALFVIRSMHAGGVSPERRPVPASARRRSFAAGQSVRAEHG